MKIDDREPNQSRAEPGAHYVTPLLKVVADQAATADTTSTRSAEVISAIKKNAVMTMTACEDLAGLNANLVDIGHELGALAPCCTSTAWIVWNHLILFHHFSGLFGPDHQDFLKSIVTNGHLITQGVGPGTAVTGTRKNGSVLVDGVTAFATGCRYSDWTGVAFIENGKKDLQFTLVDTHNPKVRVDPTWDAMSVRASATDHVYVDNIDVPAEHIVTWPMKDRETYRDPNRKMIHQRYRDCWTALGSMLMGVMASKLAGTCLDEITRDRRDRVAVFGVKWADRPLVQVNLGRARALVNAAADTSYAALEETDDRIANRVNPTEEFYLRQMLAGMQAILFCDEAMNLMQRVLGAHGLQRTSKFERRFRDFQAIPLHIIPHVDRVSEQSGKNALGIETDNPY